MRTQSHCVVAVLYPGVELLDIAGPLHILSSAGRHWNFRAFRIHTVAATLTPVQSRCQLSIAPTHCFETCPTPELLIIPGGAGVQRWLEDGQLLTWLHNACTRSNRILCIGNGGILFQNLPLPGVQSIALPAEALQYYKPVPGAPQVNTASSKQHSGKLASTAQSGGVLELSLEWVAEILGEKHALHLAAELGLPWQRTETLRVEGLPLLATLTSNDPIQKR